MGNSDLEQGEPQTIEHQGRQLRVIPMDQHDRRCDVRVASAQGTTPEVLHCHFCGFCYPKADATAAAASNAGAARGDSALELSTEQEMPVPNDSPSVQGMVRDDLVTREAIGVERYGTALQPHNGRDMLRDAYEEVLDLACYLRGAIAERPREDVDAAVTEVHRVLGAELQRKDDLIAELRRQYKVTERVRDQAIAEARQLRSAQGWDPASPQWAVVRAAVAWRNWFADLGVQVEDAGDHQQALVVAVDDLPGPDRRNAARPAKES